MSKKFFVTATGTGIGKTLVTAGLSWQLRGLGKTVAAYKPLITGFDENDPESDTALLAAALANAQPIDAISPWRYRAPLAPGMAAAAEGRAIDWQGLLTFCRNAGGGADTVLIEGIGGVMVPLDASRTVLDWMQALDFPIVLVCGSYLGSLSHTLTALSVLRERGLAVQAVVVSESEQGIGPEQTRAALQDFLPAAIPLVTVPRIHAKEPWKNLPPMTGLLAYET